MNRSKNSTNNNNSNNKSNNNKNNKTNNNKNNKKNNKKLKIQKLSSKETEEMFKVKSELEELF